MKTFLGQYEQNGYSERKTGRRHISREFLKQIQKSKKHAKKCSAALEIEDTLK